MTTLYIDADACPVKAEAERHDAAALADGAGLQWRAAPPANPFVSLMIVPEGPDVADKCRHCGPGDVVVTADIPLADRCSRPGRRWSSMTASADAGQYRRPAGDARPDAGHPQRQPFHQGRGGVFQADRAVSQSLDRVMAAALRVPRG